MKHFLSIAKKELLYLSMLSFVFIASNALVVAKNSLDKKQKKLPVYHRVVIASPLPVLGSSVSYPEFSAQGIIALDITSGTSLYEKNPDLALLPASTTKIMTALVALKHYPLNQTLRVGKEAFIDGQKMNLVFGEEISVENLLYGLLMSSANDAAEVLAANYPNGREEFVKAMNKEAQALSLKNTNFTNPTGLDERGHYSTARDLVRLSEVAMRGAFFSEIVGTKEKVVSSVDGKIKHSLTNINALLGNVEGVKGVKTGWTENARENLVTFIERDGRRILIALLGSQDRFAETRALIDWIFKNYKWEEINYSSNL